MKLEVKQDLCIGCGACVNTCPNVFSFNNEGYAQAIVEDIKEEDQEKAMEALESCPTDAIEKKND